MLLYSIRTCILCFSPYGLDCVKHVHIHLYKKKKLSINLKVACIYRYYERFFYLSIFFLKCMSCFHKIYILLNS